MYSFDSRVRYSECGEDARLTLERTIDYLQDCSTFQSESLGIGLSFMREHHFSWFISAWQIWVDRMPRFAEDITVSTWCTSIRPIEAHRNFAITGADGSPCVRADSLWFVFDTELGRPIRIPESERAYLQGDEPLDLPPTPRKIKLAGPFEDAMPIAVGDAHLDTNGHVNNAQYVRMAMDALAEPVDVRRLLVSYRQMAHAGDVVVPRIQRAETGPTTVNLTNPAGDTYAVVQLLPRTTTPDKEA